MEGSSVGGPDSSADAKQHDQKTRLKRSSFLALQANPRYTVFVITKGILIICVKEEAQNAQKIPTLRWGGDKKKFFVLS